MPLKIKIELLKAGMNQTQLAKATGLGVAKISMICNGRMIPYPSEIEKIQEALDYEKEDLFQEVTSK